MGLDQFLQSCWPEGLLRGVASAVRLAIPLCSAISVSRMWTAERGARVRCSQPVVGVSAERLSPFTACGPWVGVGGAPVPFHFSSCLGRCRRCAWLGLSYAFCFPWLAPARRVDSTGSHPRPVVSFGVGVWGPIQVPLVIQETETETETATETYTDRETETKSHTEWDSLPHPSLVFDFCTH